MIREEFYDARRTQIGLGKGETGEAEQNFDWKPVTRVLFLFDILNWCVFCAPSKAFISCIRSRMRVRILLLLVNVVEISLAEFYGFGDKNEVFPNKKRSCKFWDDTSARAVRKDINLPFSPGVNIISQQFRTSSEPVRDASFIFNTSSVQLWPFRQH